MLGMRRSVLLMDYGKCNSVVNYRFASGRKERRERRSELEDLMRMALSLCIRVMNDRASEFGRRGETVALRGKRRAPENSCNVGIVILLYLFRKIVWWSSGHGQTASRRSSVTLDIPE